MLARQMRPGEQKETQEETVNMPTWNLTLTLLPDTFAISRLSPDAALPAWARLETAASGFISITRTADELSITCQQSAVPNDVTADRDWRCLKVEGPFDLTADTGVIATLAAPLASAGIGIFTVSTYDTDHLLINETNLDRAVATLTAAGHTIRR